MSRNTRPSVAQDLHERCEQSLENELGFVHGSGAWSLTKLLYLRASASDFCPRENELQGQIGNKLAC